MKLTYFLSETHFFAKDQTLLVVNLVGALTKENAFIFQQCQEQIARSKAKWVVLNFRDVPAEIEAEFLPLFDQLRGMIHKKPSVLRISGLHPELKQTLLNRKLIEPDELSNNLAEAIQSFPLKMAA